MFDANSEPIEDACEETVPERFEVYSPREHKVAGVVGIFFCSAMSLCVIGSTYFVFIESLDYLECHADHSSFFPFICFFSIALLGCLVFAELIVESYRFNLSRKIVIEKDRLIIGGRSWDVHSLVECIDIAVENKLRLSPFHEYAVCDNNGKMIAFFSEKHRNSEQLKRWLQEGGCKQTCRYSRDMFFCHIRKKY
ncbi:MAG: hypothetical protein Q4F00_13030 [bacterium]|nr:hypothetical protein [bacterium]